MTHPVSGATPAQHPPLRLWSVPTGPLQANATVLADESDAAYLFDPGDDADTLLELVRQRQLEVRAILLTHAHFDHIGAVQPLREALGVPVYLHPRDLAIYQAGGQTAARYGLPFVQPADPEHALEQDQLFVLEGGSASISVRELPGHAPGHVVFVVNTQPALVIAGDTLFAGGIGRTDLPGGDERELLTGIRRELLSLPEDTVIYPGHGESTTVGAEKYGNPFLRGL